MDDVTDSGAGRTAAETGRAAESGRMKPRDWVRLLRSTVAASREDGVPNLAAGLTYYSLLSLFPALIVVVALLALVGRESAASVALDLVREIGPPGAVDTLRGSVERVIQERAAASSLLSLGLLAAVWSASNYVGAFMWSANQIYEVQGRPFLHRIPRQVALALGILVLLAVILTGAVITGPAAQVLGDVLGIGGPLVLAYRIARWPALFLTATVLFGVLYYFAPNVRQPSFRWITPGGVLGVTLWLLASALFGLFVRYVGDYGATYGTLAGIVVFLLWLWILNLALLVGAELNGQLEDLRARRRGVAAVSARRAGPVESDDRAA